jgi:hypothetical protein
MVPTPRGNNILDGKKMSPWMLVGLVAFSTVPPVLRAKRAELQSLAFYAAELTSEAFANFTLLSSVSLTSAI